MSFTHLLKIFILWQVAIIIITLISSGLFPLRERYLGGGTETYLKNPLLYSRANFDGYHYLGIAKNGYGYNQQGFFPLYPTLIRNLTAVFKNPALTGTIISLLSFLTGLIVLTKLLALDYSSAVIKWTVIVLLIFPTSFYFSSVYTEGLFFFLTISTFYFARTKHWWLAGIFGVLASYTRFVGIFLLPALFIEWGLQKSSIKNLFFVAIIPLGLLLYMRFLGKTTGDPLAFYNTLQLFGQEKGEKIVLLYQVFWRYFKMLATVDRSDPLYLTIILEFVTGVAFLVTTIYSFIKHRLSYAVFNSLAYLTPTFTGTFTSLPRYVLICFPSFLLIGDLLSRFPLARKIILPVFSLAFIIFLSLFARGYWVG